MKSFLRNSLIALMIAATATTFFAGCSKQDVVPAESSVSIAAEDPGVGILGDSDKDIAGSMYKVYWNDNENVQESHASKLKEAKQGATAVEGETLFNQLFQVYADEEGNKFIISNSDRVYLTENGQIPAEAVATLRQEGTGERVYVRSTEVEVTSAKNAVKDFAASCATPQLGYSGRKPISSMSDTDKELIIKSQMARINNMPSLSHTVSLNQGYVSLLDLLGAMNDMGYVTDFSQFAGVDVETNRETLEISATVVASGGNFATQVIVDAETLEIISAKTNNKEFELEQKSQNSFNTLEISLSDVEHFFGWDIEVYLAASNGSPFVNIVTDNRDIATEDSFIVYNAVKPEDIKAEETAPTVTEPEVELTMDEEEQHAFELSVKGYEAEGMSHEEAVAEATRRHEQYKKSQAEKAAKRKELFSQQEAAAKKKTEAKHKKFEQQSGITWQQWVEMNGDEKAEFMKTHPNVDYGV